MLVVFTLVLKTTRASGLNVGEGCSLKLVYREPPSSGVDPEIKKGWFEKCARKARADFFLYGVFFNINSSYVASRSLVYYF